MTILRARSSEFTRYSPLARASLTRSDFRSRSANQVKVMEVRLRFLGSRAGFRILSAIMCSVLKARSIVVTVDDVGSDDSFAF